MTPQSEAETMDLRSRVVSLEHQGTERLQRIVALETWRQHSEIQDARKDERLKSMEDLFNARFASIEKSIGSISNGISKVMWLVIAGLIAGVVGFMFKGGFYVP